MAAVPKVAAESPTLGFTHRQFEALLTTARQSPDQCDFALVALLGLLGLRIFEATSADIADLGESTATGCCAYAGKAPRSAHMLRHTFVTTMLDAGVDLRDVQIAVRHADPRTTMRYDRARQNLDRHPNYILAAFMASGT